MGVFFVYIVKSTFCLSLFYLFYKLLLSKETFHRFNRVGLLALMFLAVLIPFIQITVKDPVVMQPQVLSLEMLLLISSLAVEPAEVTTPLWIQAVLWTYLLGICFFAIRLLISLIHILRLKKQSSVIELENGVKVYVSGKTHPPFSCFNMIVVSNYDADDDNRAIIAHEMAHIKARHSFDLLLTEMCILFHWFNPAAWLIKQELQNIHEYEADESVISKGIDAKKYQLLLIKKAVGSQRFTSMANSFNHSTLKKRISMMLKGKSSPWARLKYMMVLPLAVLAITAFARPEISHELEKVSAVKFSEIVPVKEVVNEENVVESSKSIEIVTAEQSDQRISKPKVVDTTPATPQSPVTPPTPQEAVTSAVPETPVTPQSPSKFDLEFNFDNSFAFDLADMDFSFVVDMDTAEMNQRMREAMKAIGEIDHEKIGKMAEESAKQAELMMKNFQLDQAKLEEIQKQVQEMSEKYAKKIQAKAPIVSSLNSTIMGGNPLVIVDGKEVSLEEMNALDTAKIESIHILKEGAAMKEYGDKAKEGVIIITTKK